MSNEQSDAAPDEPHSEKNTEQESLDNLSFEQKAELAFEEGNIEYNSFSDTIDPIEEKSSPSDNANEPTEDQVRITLLEEELVRTKDLMMRTVAEAENGRKRAIKDREDASKFAVSSFSRDMLSVADNLRRALDAVPAELLEQNPQVKNLTDGIEATERELLRCFEKNGIQKTEPLGERFDPHFHEVMFETPMPDKENGIIIQIIEPGYTLNGRILRPARVGVAKNDGSGQAAAPQPGGNLDTEA